VVKKIAGGVGKKMFRIGLLGDMSININGEKLNHLRFAHDIVVITNRIDKAREMLRRLQNAARTMGPNLVHIADWWIFKTIQIV